MTSPAAARLVTAMTWNVWGCGPAWRARWSATAEASIHCDPDTLALQEVPSGPGDYDVDEFAGRLGHHAVTHHDPRVTERGLAVLARWPLDLLEVIALPDGGAKQEHRVAMVVQVNRPGCPLLIYNTHLNWRLDHGPIRRDQLTTILRHIADQEAAVPTLLCGDLNAGPETDEVRMLTGATACPVPGVTFLDTWIAAGNDTPGHTWTHRNPHAAAEHLGNARLDHIMIRWRADSPSPVRSARTVDGCDAAGRWPSDHAAVLATFAF